MHNEKTRLLAIVNPKFKKVTGSIAKISALLKKRDNTEKYKLYGELLTANLYRKCDYSKQIELFDYVHNKDIVVDSFMWGIHGSEKVHVDAVSPLDIMEEFQHSYKNILNSYFTSRGYKVNS